MYTRVRWKHYKRSISAMLDAVTVSMVDLRAEADPRLMAHKAVLDLSYPDHVSPLYVTYYSKHWLLYTSSDWVLDRLVEL